MGKNPIAPACAPQRSAAAQGIPEAAEGEAFARSPPTPGQSTFRTAMRLAVLPAPFVTVTV